jgi:hypothetical protein
METLRAPVQSARRCNSTALATLRHRASDAHLTA